MTLTTEMRELLEAPNWDDEGWLRELQTLMLDEVENRCMHRPWLETFATVVDVPADGRWALDDLEGQVVHWIVPGGADIDRATITTKLFEPPSQFVSFHGQLPNVRSLATWEPLDELLTLAAEETDRKFRRFRALAALGRDVRVGIWDDYRSKMWIDDEGVLHFAGKSIVAAMVNVGTAIASDAPTPDPSVTPAPAVPAPETGPAVDPPHVPEPELPVAPEPAPAPAPAPEKTEAEEREEDEEPKTEPYDEPVGDIQPYRDPTDFDHDADFAGVATAEPTSGMSGARRASP